MNKILRFSDSEKVFQCPICKTDLKLKQKVYFVLIIIVSIFQKRVM